MRKAYTLVEILIVVAVLGILGGVAYNIVSKVRDAAETVDVRAQLISGARTAMAEMVRDLSESDNNTLTKDGTGAIPSFIDPINSETHQILVFASARGNPADASEDGSHANNDYVHLDADYKLSWRSAIVYCTYQTTEGIQQLRKYVDYGNYSAAGMFPFSLVSITAGAITLSRGDGTALIIVRNSGSVRANYIATEDANRNNQDGVPDAGTDFSISGSRLSIKLFLAKLEYPTKGGNKFLTVTLTDSVVMRNK